MYIFISLYNYIGISVISVLLFSYYVYSEECRRVSMYLCMRACPYMAMNIYVYLCMCIYVFVFMYEMKK